MAFIADLFFGKKTVESKSIVNDTFETIAREAVTTTQRCSATSQQTQDISIVNSFDVRDVSQDSVVKMVQNCQQNATTAAETVANVARKLDQKSTQTSDSLGDFLSSFAPGSTSKTNYQELNIKTRLEQMLTVDTLNEMTSKLVAAQRISISGSGGVSGIRQSQLIETASTALQSTAAGAKLKADIENLVAQENATRNEGLFTSGAAIWIIVAVAVVGGIYVYNVYGRRQRQARRVSPYYPVGQPVAAPGGYQGVYPYALPSMAASLPAPSAAPRRPAAPPPPPPMTYSSLPPVEGMAAPTPSLEGVGGGRRPLPPASPPAIPEPSTYISPS